MAKKARQALAEPNPSAVPNRDVLNRLNFMYQAAVLLSAVVPAPAQPRPSVKPPAHSKMLVSTQPGQADLGDVSMECASPSQDWLALDRAPVSPTDSTAEEPIASTSALTLDAQPADKQKLGGRKKRTGSAYELAGQVLVRNMREVAKKATLRMSVARERSCFMSINRQLLIRMHVTGYRDPTVKRTFCRGCNQVLVAGLTASVRVKREQPPRRLSRSSFAIFR